MSEFTRMILDYFTGYLHNMKLKSLREGGKSPHHQEEINHHPKQKQMGISRNSEL